MGLGLAISRRFCQMMGGDIHSREQARPWLDLHDPAAEDCGSGGCSTGSSTIPDYRGGKFCASRTGLNSRAAASFCCSA
jgi:signal transduction histidine kinase